MADTKEIIDVNLTEQAGATTTVTEAPTVEEAAETVTADDVEAVDDTAAETEATETDIVTASETTTGTFTISSVGWGTIYLDVAFVMPEGVTGYIVTTTKADGTLLFSDLYTGGKVVPAYTALLLKGEAKTYEYTITTCDETAPTNNLLHGTINSELTNVEGATVYYKLSTNNDGEVGWFWGAENGGAFMNGANKAYLAVNKKVDNNDFTFSDADIADSEETYDVAAAYRKATGLVGVDVTELAKTATTPILKMTLFNGLMWHLGRITSCDNEDHTAHTGKYNADGTDSKLVKALKGMFEID